MSETMSRALLVVTNLTALPSIWLADSRAYKVGLAATMLASVWFHATVGSTVTTFWGHTMRTGLDGPENHGQLALLVDELLAVGMMAMTLWRFGRVSLWPRPIQLHAACALTSLAAGELLFFPLDVVAHSWWHVLAFSLPAHLAILQRMFTGDCTGRQCGSSLP